MPVRHDDQRRRERNPVDCRDDHGAISTAAEPGFEAQPVIPGGDGLGFLERL